MWREDPEVLLAAIREALEQELVDLPRGYLSRWFEKHGKRLLPRLAFVMDRVSLPAWSFRLNRDPGDPIYEGAFGPYMFLSPWFNSNDGETKPGDSGTRYWLRPFDPIPKPDSRQPTWNAAYYLVTTGGVIWKVVVDGREKSGSSELRHWAREEADQALYRMLGCPWNRRKWFRAWAPSDPDHGWRQVSFWQACPWTGRENAAHRQWVQWLDPVPGLQEPHRPAAYLARQKEGWHGHFTPHHGGGGRSLNWPGRGGSWRPDDASLDWVFLQVALAEGHMLPSTDPVLPVEPFGPLPQLLEDRFASVLCHGHLEENRRAMKRVSVSLAEAVRTRVDLLGRVDHDFAIRFVRDFLQTSDDYVDHYGGIISLSLDQAVPLLAEFFESYSVPEMFSQPTLDAIAEKARAENRHLTAWPLQEGNDDPSWEIGPRGILRHPDHPSMLHEIPELL